METFVQPDTTCSNNILCSVIIPAYNAGNYLTRCIDSLLKQTFNHFEIIIINDGSEDNTEQIAISFQKKDKRIYYIRQANGGASSARNLGIEKAKGKWVTFVDADDEVQKDYLNNFFQTPLSHNDLVIQGHTEVDYDNIKAVRHPIIEHKTIWNNICIGVSRLRLLHRGHSVGKLYNLQILKNNELRFDPQWKYKEDLVFLLSYLRYTKRIIAIPNCSYIYYHNFGSLSSRKWPIDYLIDNTKFILKQINDIEQLYDNRITQSYLNEYLSFCTQEQIDSLYHTPLVKGQQKRINYLRQMRDYNYTSSYPYKYKSDKTLSILFKYRMWHCFDLIQVILSTQRTTSLNNNFFISKICTLFRI